MTKRLTADFEDDLYKEFRRNASTLNVRNQKSRVRSSKTG